MGDLKPLARIIDLVDDRALVAGWARAIKSRNTRHAYSEGVNRFLTFCYERSVRLLEATPEQFADWMQGERERCSVATCNVRLAGNRKFFAHAIQRGWIKKDPSDGVRPLPVSVLKAQVAVDHEADRDLLKSVGVLLRGDDYFREHLAALVAEHSGSLVESQQGRRPYVNARRRAANRLEKVTACAYCGREGTSEVDPDNRTWHMDHVIPVARGGSNDLGNIVKSCARCNQRKGASAWHPISGAITADGASFAGIENQDGRPSGDARGRGSAPRRALNPGP